MINLSDIIIVNINGEDIPIKRTLWNLLKKYCKLKKVTIDEGLETIIRSTMNEHKM